MAVSAKKARMAEMLALLVAQRFIPLFTHGSARVVIIVLQMLYKAGFRCFELGNRLKAETKAKALTKAVTVYGTVIKFFRCHAADYPGLKIGIGTVRTVAQARAFITLGVDFIVGPNYNKAVLKACNAAGILYVPGTRTATEAIAAHEADALAIKIFPIQLDGPVGLKALLAVLGDTIVIGTGGMNPRKIDDLALYFAAGMSACAVGTELFKPDDVIAEDSDVPGRFFVDGKAILDSGKEILAKREELMARVEQIVREEGDKKAFARSTAWSKAKVPDSGWICTDEIAV